MISKANKNESDVIAGIQNAKTNYQNIDSSNTTERLLDSYSQEFQLSSQLDQAKKGSKIIDVFETKRAQIRPVGMVRTSRMNIQKNPVERKQNHEIIVQDDSLNSEESHSSINKYFIKEFKSKKVKKYKPKDNLNISAEVIRKPNEEKPRYPSQIKVHPSAIRDIGDMSQSVENMLSHRSISTIDIETGFPDPDKYDNFYINKYSLPNAFKCGHREDKEIRKKINMKNAYLIHTPYVRKGISGWKLSTLKNPNQNQTYEPKSSHYEQSIHK